MKKILLIILAPLLIHAQDATKDQSIELPEFVITGERNISIPVMKKHIPELVPTLSDNFFRPIFTPEQLALSKRSDPIDRELILYRNSRAYDGLLILGAGYRTLPQGELFFNQNIDNFLFKSRLYGSNTTEYIENSDYNISGIDASLNFYVNNQSSFLPGLNIRLAGDFFRDTYKFYGSDDPTYKRETFNTFGVLSFQSDISKNVKYALSGKTELLELKDINFKENVYSAELDLDVMFSSYGIGTGGIYKFQDIDNSSIKSNNYYYGGNLYVIIEPSNGLKLKLGGYYSGIESKQFLAPFGTVSLKLDNNLTLFGKYQPNTEFFTYNDFIHVNKFIGVNSNENIFQENNLNTSVLLKYQYMKYYEINVGASYANVDDLPYFDDSETKGVFLLNKVRDINRIQAYVNLLFHNGPSGFLYGEIKYNRVKFNSGKNVPYYPALSTGLIYGYDFGESLTAKTKLDFYFENYADIENSIKLPTYIDWSLYLYYNLFGNLKLTVAVENLLNRKNYVYDGYLEKTLDIIGGVEYRW